MRQLAFVFMFLVGGVSFADEVPAPLASMRDICDKSLVKIDEELQARLNPLRQRYRHSLVEIRDRAKNTGDIDLLVEVKEELARFLLEKTIPEKPAAGTSPMIAEAQIRFHKAASGLRREAARKQLSLFSKYMTRLEGLLKDYVRKEQIQQGYAVKEEMEKIKGKLTVLETGRPVSASLNPIARTFDLGNLETFRGEWRLEGSKFTAHEDGIKGPRGPANHLESHFKLLGDFEVFLRFHFGQAAYTNTGGTWIKVCGEKLGITNGFRGLDAEIKVQRKGPKLIFTHNKKVTEHDIKPENLDKPTTFYLWWRSRSCHFKELTVKADAFATD